MSPHAITVILLLFCLGRQNATPDPTSYVASVVEYSPYSPSNTVDNVEQNLRAMQLLVEAAAKNGTQIVVFPEYGVIGFPYGNRSQLSEKLEQIPDNPPSGERIIPCNNSSFSKSPVFQNLSCLALSYNIVLIVNTGDKQPCPTSTIQCPSSGFYQYNTDIAFDSDGAYLAKYHKKHLYKQENEIYDIPPLEVVSFTTKFGVTFGMFTCFDILFDSPAMNLVDNGVKNFVYTTFWGSQFPDLVSIAVQQSWSMLTSTNLIAANIHCQAIDKRICTEVPATGSGIYTSGTVLTNYISGDVFPSGYGFIKSSKVPAQPKQSIVNSRKVLTFGHNASILMKNVAKYTTYTELDINSSSASVNDTTGTVGCSVDFKFKTKAGEERYAIGADRYFANYSNTDTLCMVAFCTLVKCNENGQCGDTVQQASSVFQYIHLTASFPENITRIFPLSLGNHFSLLHPQDMHFESSSLSLNGVDQPILAASLWGVDRCISA